MITNAELTALILAIITTARIIVRLTPTRKDDNIFIKVMKFVEALGVPDVMSSGLKKKIVKSKK